MPKPLSQINKNARMEIFPSALCRRPVPASHVMLVIASWASIEQTKSLFLSRMLSADIPTVSAMYNSIKSDAAKNQIIHTAAKRTLPEWQYILIQAVERATRPSLKTRNKFAHWLWAFSYDVPQKYILMADPEALTEHQVNKDSIAYNVNSIIAYTEDEILKCSQDADRAQSAYSCLYATRGETVETARVQLLMMPEVALVAQTLSQKSSQEVQSKLHL